MVFSHIFLSKRSLHDETVLENKVNKVTNRFASRWSFTTLTVASSPIQRGSPGFLMQKGRGFLYSLRELLKMDFMEIKIKATSLGWKPFFFSFMVTISFRLHCKVFNYYFQHFLRILLPVDTLRLDCEQCLMVFFWVIIDGERAWGRKAKPRGTRAEPRVKKK